MDVRVDLSAAMRVCDTHPAIDTSARVAHNFWNVTGCLVPVVGVVCLFFIPWYFALAMIVIGVALIMPTTRKTAGEVVFETALKNKQFYQEMIAQKVIVCRLKD